MENLWKTDKEIARAILDEIKRQEYKLEMIASENFVSLAVLEAAGSILTNKYAEGYPGKRYYGGCEFVDIAENLAIERAKKLFNAKFINVQPHSGSQANMAVYFALLDPGDTILSMDLSHGGHLTHGAKVNFSGKLFNIIHYTVDKETELIDYNMVEDLAIKHTPKIILAGWSAYPRELDFKKFREIADKVNAYLVTDMAHFAGLVSAGLHSNPVEYSDVVTTTTHKTLRGPRGGMILTNNEDLSIKINKSIFPGIQGGPLMHIIAAKAVAFKEALSDEFKEYQKSIKQNAYILAEELMKQGLKLCTNGTDTHLMLVDLRKTNDLTGKQVEDALNKAGITVNKNTVPFETRSPFITSGIRIGTPALTTRGMRENEMKQIAFWIKKIIDNIDNENIINNIKSEVKQLCEKFPLYKALLEQNLAYTK